ncbi:MAG TPA: SprB repeat-containing protein, partial [Bacteroidales bacterium]|nr:SprB repeat-containing protein [Bacteroidales bacterium]HPS74673.1 SprB repeat-containing protein [Bacteroidales bacterium]
MLTRIRYILLTILLIAASQAAGQYIIDEVCIGSTRYYRVDGEAGSTYTWMLTDPLGNVDTLSSTADTVAINWTVAPGTYKLSTIQHAITGCDGVLEIGTIEVFEQPLAFAGTAMVFCAPGFYSLSEATASNYSSLLWTTSGDGTFDNDTILHPIYTPGPGDLSAGTVTLTLTAQGLGSSTACTPAVSSVVIVQPAAAVSVTTTFSPASCYGWNDGTATANVTGGMPPYTYLWSNGQTSNPAVNLTAGTYTVLVSDTNNCTAIDTVIITQPPSITVYAGPDNDVCETGFLSLSGAIASNDSAVLWTTSGDGSFADPSVVNALYTPGPADILSGTVTLTLTAFGLGFCPDSSDFMILTVSRQAMVNAGPDDTICGGNTYTITGASASNYTSLQWTHNGEGSLNDPTLLNPVYTPAPNESGLITFTLTGSSTYPCVDSMDQMTLTIWPLPTGTLSGNTKICEGDTAVLTLTFYGTPPISATYTD